MNGGGGGGANPFVPNSYKIWKVDALDHSKGTTAAFLEKKGRVATLLYIIALALSLALLINLYILQPAPQIVEKVAPFGEHLTLNEYELLVAEASSHQASRQDQGESAKSIQVICPCESSRIEANKVMEWTYTMEQLCQEAVIKSEQCAKSPACSSNALSKGLLKVVPLLCQFAQQEIEQKKAAFEATTYVTPVLVSPATFANLIEGDLNRLRGEIVLNLKRTLDTLKLLYATERPHTSWTIGQLRQALVPVAAARSTEGYLGNQWTADPYGCKDIALQVRCTAQPGCKWFSDQSLRDAGVGDQCIPTCWQNPLTAFVPNAKSCLDRRISLVGGSSPPVCNAQLACAPKVDLILSAGTGDSQSKLQQRFDEKLLECGALTENGQDACNAVQGCSWQAACTPVPCSELPSDGDIMTCMSFSMNNAATRRCTDPSISSQMACESYQSCRWIDPTPLSMPSGAGVAPYCTYAQEMDIQVSGVLTDPIAVSFQDTSAVLSVDSTSTIPSMGGIIRAYRWPACTCQTDSSCTARVMVGDPGQRGTSQYAGEIQVYCTALETMLAMSNANLTNDAFWQYFGLTGYDTPLRRRDLLGDAFLLDSLMDSDNLTYSFSQYLDQCAPGSCSYVKLDSPPPLDVLTTVAGLFGGLSVLAWRLVDILLKCWRPPKHLHRAGAHINYEMSGSGAAPPSVSASPAAAAGEVDVEGVEWRT